MQPAAGKRRDCLVHACSGCPNPVKKQAALPDGCVRFMAGAGKNVITTNEQQHSPANQRSGSMLCLESIISPLREYLHPSPAGKHSLISLIKPSTVTGFPRSSLWSQVALAGASRLWRPGEGDRGFALGLLRLFVVS
jgi:hypothetical protein